MLNINYGRNSELMEKCLQLSEYAMFVAEVRKNLKEEHDKVNSGEEAISNAVSKAIEALPKESEIRKFLEKNRAEVTGMCLREYDEKRTMELFKNEWKEEGRQEGLEEGEKKFSSLMEKLLSVGKMDDIRRVVEDEEYREKLYMEYGISGSIEKTS
jgi:flagellar biosynthesis/type III secretory pathway protein FliH